MSSADLNAQAHKVVDSDWMSMKYCSSAGKNTFWKIPMILFLCVIIDVVWTPVFS